MFGLERPVVDYLMQLILARSNPVDNVGCIRRTVTRAFTPKDIIYMIKSIKVILSSKYIHYLNILRKLNFQYLNHGSDGCTRDQFLNIHYNLQVNMYRWLIAPDKMNYDKYLLQFAACRSDKMEERIGSNTERQSPVSSDVILSYIVCNGDFCNLF
ncbi:hypothetical protein BDA99DRAFT_532872 [Phascolomyces articulosus]|uniref:Uncharacterized protein n=1 Tax=Phascolomyces articulosus TaxID=60185 RepID=A0AAD5PJA1_9FUNG|nr:hypothetical protein BDA99DRAFT_532872 [Phascolomyces articulosus]